VDFIDSYELSFMANQLLFHDLMLIASGRFLTKAINYEGGYSGNKEVTDTSSLLLIDQYILSGRRGK